MSDVRPEVDRTALRKAIRDTVREADDAPPREEVVTTVAQQAGVSEAAVHDELDQLEQHGFVYLVGDDAEVKLP